MELELGFYDQMFHEHFKGISVEVEVQVFNQVIRPEKCSKLQKDTIIYYLSVFKKMFYLILNLPFKNIIQISTKCLVFHL